jgi:NAD(P)-dependent dehydrogenase (short-subunit alcohol dehydrogenase family)
MATVLIAGANRGIGRRLAEDLAARGDSVLGTARGTPPDDMAARAIRFISPRAAGSSARRFASCPVSSPNLVPRS